MQRQLVVKDRFGNVASTITFEHDAIENYIQTRSKIGSRFKTFDQGDLVIDMIIPTLTAITITATP